MKKLFQWAKVVVFLLFIVVGIGSLSAKPKEVVYTLTCSAQPIQRFNDLPCGLIVTTSCDVDNSQIFDLSQISEKEAKKVRKTLSLSFKPDIAEFFDESFKKYVRSTGINMGYDRSKDFSLKVKLKEFKVTEGMGGAPCTAVIEWTLTDPDNKIVLEGTAKGRNTMALGQSLPDVLDSAYSRAINDIDWGGIAWNMSKSETDNKRADQEKSKQVKGDGDTALEHTVIRWYIMSAPAGADVSWRVVSSTPDVKNTNSTYVGTTPYETTESFDIRGLKYDNAGNVQIEISCEKNGYVTQRKRFNLRQAIDQREISAKFNLVAEGE
ncbi:MAG: hypothetical protein HDR97_04765 [Bacteroides sp.]|nr:hypothetical protein [Bacteroides sp.]MBD5333036.1 hypothetical protein [Bacteroides sp.]